MIRRRIRLSATVAALAASALLLAGCGGGAPAGSPTPTDTAIVTPEPDPTPTPTVEPDPEPAASVTLPTDCSTLGTDPVRSETIGDLTLQSNGEGFVRPAPEGATLALGCDWIVGDSTGMLLLISTADPAAVTTAVGTLPGLGYTCQVSDDFGADFCDLPGDAADTEEMIVARDGVWIYLSTSNRNGRALLSEIVQGIFT